MLKCVPDAVTGASPMLPSVTAPVTVPCNNGRVITARNSHRYLLAAAIRCRVSDRVVDNVTPRRGFEPRDLIQRVRPSPRCERERTVGVVA